eukprot:scaffold549_cov117-Isochrysis_galbana.AAC.9
MVAACCVLAAAVLLEAAGAPTSSAVSGVGVALGEVVVMRVGGRKPPRQSSRQNLALFRGEMPK